MTGTYNIRDDDGNLLGTLDAQPDGSIAIEHAGSGEQAVLNGDGLTAPAVNAEEERIGTARKEVREINTFDADDDANSNLSLSLSNIDSSQEVELVVVIDGNGGGATSTINIQINGATSGYEQNTVAAGSVSSAGPTSQWSFEVFNSTFRRDRFLIDSGGHITQMSGGAKDRETILSGNVSGQSSVFSIDVFAAFDASGRAYAIEVSDQS